MLATLAGYLDAHPNAFPAILGFLAIALGIAIWYGVRRPD